MLKKCMSDSSFIIPNENVGTKESLSYAEILSRYLIVKFARTKKVASVKILWGNEFVEEDMKNKYLFAF